MRGLAIVFTIAAACGDHHAAPDAAPDARAVVDAQGAPDATADSGHFSQGMRVVDACKTLGIGTEVCDYTFLYSPSMCANQGCKRLVIYFSGGQETCPSVSDSASYLVFYENQGYVAVCARAFTSASGSGQFPRHLEAPRFDALVTAITSDPDIRAGWSGEYLLFSGVSHGASGPVVAMADTTDDDAAAWKGSAYTGACFLDGTYDAGGLIDFTYTNQCTDSAAVVPYSRAYGRYCTFTGNGDTPGTWPLPATCATADVTADTITTAPVSAFAIKDWKLVECGSAQPACSGPIGQQDVLPASSVTALCSHLAASSDHTCTPQSYPTTGHVFCGIDQTTISTCYAWFESELTSHGF